MPNPTIPDVARLRTEQYAREGRIATLSAAHGRARTTSRLHERCSQMCADVKLAVGGTLPLDIAQDLARPDIPIDLRAVERWLRDVHAHECMPAAGGQPGVRGGPGEESRHAADGLLTAFEREAIADLT